MNEPIAWLVATGAGMATLFCIYVLTRPLRNGFLKVWLRCVSMVVLLLPAPVPRFDAYYAPAFVVALFEAALQHNGDPTPALGLLAVGIATVSALVGGYSYWRHRSRRRAPCA